MSPWGGIALNSVGFHCTKQSLQKQVIGLTGERSIMESAEEPPFSFYLGVTRGWIKMLICSRYVRPSPVGGLGKTFGAIQSLANSSCDDDDVSFLDICNAAGTRSDRFGLCVASSLSSNGVFPREQLGLLALGFTTSEEPS